MLTNNTTEDITIDDETLEEVTSFKYLEGTMFTDNIRTAEALLRIAMTRGYFSIPNQYNLFQSLEEERRRRREGVEEVGGGINSKQHRTKQNITEWNRIDQNRQQTGDSSRFDDDDDDNHANHDAYDVDAYDDEEEEGDHHHNDE
ncbi:hypothetical protein DPMN_062379 [Dreissena polymorpha]|uniref:Uncharacterized protein n=1 Tax=Dreissena polymorpha TaxID=45954 RepID=A0A9D4C9D8_DREPO|nr:hypothetical protein DPMN_062379 [Dreissena polymorpha]